ncbi:solute carrier family 22 member 13 [Galendromus occidentalis]|uniref:Solute carrier family 22 member 13 n=1 Tax=Galendromus occidentalis TaxID=34638 RepID=A0AAJ6QTU2_9ACAR|nr:solute carrier family 22 member 13 [Galendromus occidentalis]
MTATASGTSHVETGAKNEKVTLDALFERLGRWHLPIFVFGFLRGSPVILSMMFVVFAAPIRQEYWCADPGFNSTNICDGSCQRFEFDRRVYGYTLMEEFDLVCSRSWLASLAQSLYLSGLMVGGIIHAHISDWWGRRFSAIVSLILTIITTAATAYSPSVEVFIVGRFLTACSLSGFAEAAFTIVIETVHPSMRYMPTLTIGTGISTGMMILAVSAYVLRDWIHMQLFIVATMLLLTALWTILPESPRWQLSTGRYEAAERSLEKVVKHQKNFNETHVKAIIEENKSATRETKTTRPTLGTVFAQYPLVTCVFCFCQSTSNMAWYYLTVSTTSVFNGDPYLAFLVAAISEIPAKLMNTVLIKFVPRKRSLFWSFMFSAVVLIVAIWVPSEYSWIKLISVILGRMCCSMNQSVNRVAVTESYPTVIRAIAVSMVGMTGRMGACVAPFFEELERMWSSLPIMIIAGLCCVAAVATQLLEETFGRALPDRLKKEKSPENDVHFADCNIHCMKYLVKM